MQPEIPPHWASVSPVATNGNVPNRHELPLNLIIQIVSYLDDVADISRITRTSKLLYYMSLPRLYESVTLRSYSEVRYFNNRPEGYGSGSPFSVGLNGLVTGNVAGYVRNWRLTGEWREKDVDDFTKGRVPDNTMMLNIAVRAAMDKMMYLQAFSWELNTKPLATVYSGLTLRKCLTSLTIRFPSSRIPRPTVLIPPIPTLKIFKAHNIDPICYPDDISLLLLQSLQLEDLTLEWSSRMRDEGDPSVNLQTYFGKVLAAKTTITLKHLRLKNMFARNNRELDLALNHLALRTMTLIRCVNPDDPVTVFIDDTWKIWGAPPPKEQLMQLTLLRADGIDRAYVQSLAQCAGLTELYLVNAKYTPETGPMLNEPRSANGSPVTLESFQTRPPQQDGVRVAADYLAAITSLHGDSLKILLLSDQWMLGQDAIENLMRKCPNLEELALGVENNDLDHLRYIVSLGPYLRVLRILINPIEPFWQSICEVPDSRHAELLGHELWKPEYRKLEYVGLGTKGFELGDVVPLKNSSTDHGGAPGYRRLVRPVPWEKLKEVRIFGMDTLDL